MKLRTSLVVAPPLSDSSELQRDFSFLLTADPRRSRVSEWDSRNLAKETTPMLSQTLGPVRIRSLFGQGTPSRLGSDTPGVYKEGYALRCCGSRNGRIPNYAQVCRFQTGVERRTGPHSPAVPARKSPRETCENSAERKVRRCSQTPVSAWKSPNRIYLAAMPKPLA